jgi:hypothetical protein
VAVAGTMSNSCGSASPTVSPPTTSRVVAVMVPTAVFPPTKMFALALPDTARVCGRAGASGKAQTWEVTGPGEAVLTPLRPGFVSAPSASRVFIQNAVMSSLTCA